MGCTIFAYTKNQLVPWPKKSNHYGFNFSIPSGVATMSAPPCVGHTHVVLLFESTHQPIGLEVEDWELPPSLGSGPNWVFWVSYRGLEIIYWI